MWGDIAIAFLLAFVTAYVLTPYTIRLSKKIGALDVPKEKRKIHNKSINDSLITIYIFLLEISNYKEEYQNFVEQNSKRIFEEKQNKHWYTIKLQYYYNLNKKDEYLKLYDLQLDNKVKNPLFKIMYLILNEEYEEALELSKKVTSQQKDIGYVMRLYYRIICLEHLEKENELNDCINEMVEFNDQIHYVKEIKDKYKEELVFYRLGDFYEMFFDDALIASRELELTLTGRVAGLEEKVPMCGVPHANVKTYIEKLVNKGYRVAICEQLEDPRTTKGMVKRGIVDVISKGTIADNDLLNDKDSSYIASILLIVY